MTLDSKLVSACTQRIIKVKDRTVELRIEVEGRGTLLFWLAMPTYLDHQPAGMPVSQGSLKYAERTVPGPMSLSK